MTRSRALRDLDAVVFDMDGVVTDTARVHFAAWKQVFDAFLEDRGGSGSQAFTDADYRRYVDGRPRYDGVAGFLASRGIELPYGTPDDPPDRDTVCGIGNRKNAAFLQRLDEDGVDPFPSTVRFIRWLHDHDIATAIISASRNAEQVLEAGGVRDLFAVKVDGVDRGELDVPGKPDPAVFLEAVRRLGVDPSDAGVVEDAIAGVEAGRRGGFAVVIGVDRGDNAEDLRAAGADIVVRDLAELDLTDHRTIDGLPSATDHAEELAIGLEGRTPAVFLDYDGVLSPIVDDPAAATLPPRTADALERLRRVCPVSIVSGRDLDDVRGMVGIDELTYAGSHGFDILEADGTTHQKGREFLGSLEAAERELTDALADIGGARVERKRFAIAVHDRQVADADLAEVEEAIRDVAGRHDDLRVTGGKRIHELRPDIDWDKGRALMFLLDTLDLGDDVVPIYVGDDVTDEDAFRALDGRGLAIVVRGEDDDRATAADYSLPDTEAARTFLEQLATLLEERR